MKKHIWKDSLKAAGLLLFIITAVVLFNFTSLRQYIQPQALQEWVRSFGPLAPSIFILLYGAGVSCFLPATLFTGIGAVLFGVFWGFLYNLAGAMLGAALGFFIGRYLGRDFAAAHIGGQLQKYDDKIAANGFATILYLRLIFLPFAPLNFGMGLTKITFISFIAGTFFGIIAGGFAITFFFATLTEVIASGQWHTLINWKSAAAVALLAGSFAIPVVVKKIFTRYNVV